MNIRITGVKETIGRLKKYRAELSDKNRTFLEKLAEIGIDTASVRFSQAQYDGENDVVVGSSPEWLNDDTLVIKAAGQAVLFIEFGTGVHYSEQHPKAAELGFTRGSYGQGKGKQDSWGYYGAPGTNGRTVVKKDGSTVVITHGNPPARAMYDASKEMRENILSVAKEVFGGD